MASRSDKNRKNRKKAEIDEKNLMSTAISPLGMAIRHFRDEKRLTQEDIVNAAGEENPKFDKQRISDIETGRVASLHAATLNLIAKGLGVTVAELKKKAEEFKRGAVPSHESTSDFQAITNRLIKSLGGVQAPTTTLDQIERLIDERTRQFFGREDQIAELDQFVRENERGVVVVTAPGGFGKSALLANWGLRLKARGGRIARHFFNGTMHRTVEIADALKGLVFQLAALRDAELFALPDERAKLEDMLNTDLCKDATASTPLVVVLDGLDEAAQLVEAITPAKLGKHVYIVVSGRAEEGDRPRHIASWFFAQNTVKYPIIRFSLKALTIQGVLQWLHGRAPSLNNVMAQRLLATTNGVPLFLRFIIDDIRLRVEAGVPADELKQCLITLPAPFVDYAAEQLQAMSKLEGRSPGGWDINVQRIFALLTLIRGTMSASEIAAVLGSRMNVAGLDARVTRWFAIRTGEKTEKQPSIAFLHPRLAEVFRHALAQRAETQGLVHEAEQQLIEYCSAWKTNNSRYSLAHLPFHFAQGGKPEQALDTLTSIEFLSARLAHADAPTLIAGTVTDLALLSDTVPTVSKLKVKSWLSFWAIIEPLLIGVLLGPRPEEGAPLLVQCLADTVGAPGDAVAKAGINNLTWRQLSGRQAASNILRTLTGHMDTVNGAVVLADNRILSWSDDHTLRLWASDGTPLTELRGHTDSVSGALMLANSRILSWSDDHTLRLWASDGTPLAELRGHTDSVSGALVLANNRILSWSVDHTLRLWASDGAPLAELKGHISWVNGALELSNGHLLSWDGDHTLRLWAADGTQFTELRGRSLEADLVWDAGALELSNGHLLSWSDNDSLRLWTANGVPLPEFDGQAGGANGALELADSRLLSWSWDYTLRLWTTDGVQLAELDGHTKLIRGALELADGRLLSWSDDDSLRLWAADGTPLAKLKGHTGDVRGALELVDGRLLSWSNDYTLRLWMADGTPCTQLKGHTNIVIDAQVLSDGRILSWSADHTLRLWAANGVPCDELKGQGHTGWVINGQSLADGRLLSWSFDRTLRLWAADGTPLTELGDHTESVRGALVLADGRILSRSRDHTLRLWASDGAPLAELRGHTDSVSGALELADNRILSWSDDHTLRLWASDGTPLAKLKGNTKWVKGALALADGRLLSWGGERTLRLWASDGAPLAKLKGHTDCVYGALALADGRMLSWSRDRTLRLWASDGALLAKLKGHTKWVEDVLALADGRILSWSNSKILRLWTADGTPFSELKGHAERVGGALELADGRLLSWSDDHTLRLWRADGTPLAELKGHTGRVRGALELADGRLLSWSDDHTLRLWRAGKVVSQSWLWPHSVIQHVILHTLYINHFWVLADNDVILLSHRHLSAS
jgi:transcriptional regulator with XRE-family HTH domain